MRSHLIFAFSFAFLAAIVSAQAAETAPETKPATRPSTNASDPRGKSADEMLGNMLRPGPGGQAKPLTPLPPPPSEVAKTPASVHPNASNVPTLREGTLILDRPGRMIRSADGSQAEFVFEADGKTMRDPPMVILPNIQLMAMENAVTGANRDLRFRVSGTVTEYKGRNYLLLMKVLVVPDITQQF
jgi:hypothetical protein